MSKNKIPTDIEMAEQSVKYWAERREQALLDSEYYALKEAESRIRLHDLKDDYSYE